MLKSRLPDVLWFLAWAVVSSAWCVGAANQLGATFDEPIYMEKGLEHWRTGSYAGLLSLGTMPLPVDANTLPVHLWETWRGTPFDAKADLHQFLPLARLGTLVFWWVLLFYGWRIAWTLAGPWGGRLVLPILACEPSLLAHASLATTDMAISACMLGLVYHFATARDAGWFWRVGIPSIWFGLAFLSKASGVVFGPICLLAIEAQRYWMLTRSTEKPARSLIRRLMRSALDMGTIGVLGVTLAFIYCGSDWQTKPSFIAWAHSLPADGAYRDSMVWLSENLRIFSNAGEGLVRQVKHNVKSHNGAFLLGEVAPRAIWYYFPVVLTIKLTLTLLILPFLGRFSLRSLGNWACLAALALLLFSVTYRVQIGIRLVLPLVGLATAGLVAAAVNAWREYPPRFQAVGLGVAVVLLGWSTWSAASVWPNGLCYTNEAWGGTAEGYRRLSDSNYDWGQGLVELRDWQARHDDAPLDLWYFGKDPLYGQPPLRHVMLHVCPIRTPADLRAKVKGHRLAVGTTILYGVPNSEAHRIAAEYLRTLEPVGRTSTFFIYDFCDVE